MLAHTPLTTTHTLLFVADTAGAQPKLTKRLSLANLQTFDIKSLARQASIIFKPSEKGTSHLFGAFC